MFFQRKNAKEQKVEQVLLENYNRYYRLAYSYVHKEADAEDIVQNAAYKAILNSDKLKQEAYASTWVYRIVLNEIYRVLAQKPTVSIDDAYVEQGKEDSYENLDLWRALELLDKEDKAVIELRYFEDMKFSDIAEVLQENVNTIKSRLYRALKKLKLELAETDIFAE
ncbi:MAG: sigma-70 family RNA polymerase sigma factor [Lachnospiraceae bacterium]|nr:sigma-70 family RNA polymerase sigma factor [Lachnospiraceae bacterium]